MVKKFPFLNSSTSNYFQFTILYTTKYKSKNVQTIFQLLMWLRFTAMNVLLVQQSSLQLDVKIPPKKHAQEKYKKKLKIKIRAFPPSWPHSSIHQQVLTKAEHLAVPCVACRHNGHHHHQQHDDDACDGSSTQGVWGRSTNSQKSSLPLSTTPAPQLSNCGVRWVSIMHQFWFIAYEISSSWWNFKCYM